MPTGYTSTLHDGEQSFEDFIWDCARAFGALITLRDEPDARIPEVFLPSPYYANQVRDAEERIAWLEGLSPSARQAEASEAYLKASGRHAQRSSERDAMRARYEAMLAKVRAWTPPTGEHQELRDFMVQQLEESIRFDCYDQEAPSPVTADEWLRHELALTKRHLDYCRKALVEEEERCRQRTEWVRELRNSLEGVSA